MQKLVLIMLVCGVAVGSMMPAATPMAPPTASETLYVEGSAAGAQSPESEVNLRNGAISLERSADGHFYAEAQVNGMPVRFLIDTGASGIALSHADAQHAAVPMTPSMNQVVGSGASGEVRGQFVELDRVNLGLKELRGVEAVVLEGGTQSLLGQSFLAQFGSVSIEGDQMVLH